MELRGYAVHVRTAFLLNCRRCLGSENEAHGHIFPLIVIVLVCSSCWKGLAEEEVRLLPPYIVVKINRGYQPEVASCFPCIVTQGGRLAALAFSSPPVDPTVTIQLPE